MFFRMSADVVCDLSGSAGPESRDVILTDHIHHEVHPAAVKGCRKIKQILRRAKVGIHPCEISLEGRTVSFRRAHL